MTDFKTQLEEALQNACISFAEFDTHGTTYTVIHNQSEAELSPILEAAHRYLKALPILEEIHRAGESATQGEFFYDDEEPTISSENGIAWDYEDGWGSVEDREFFMTCANLRPAIEKLMEE